MNVPALTNGGVKWSFAPRFEDGVGIARVPSSFDQSASDRLNGLCKLGAIRSPGTISTGVPTSYISANRSILFNLACGGI